MRPTLRLGRVAGIPVGVNWGVLVIVVLLVVGLAFGSFPALYPGRGVAVYLLASVVAAVLFIASLLAHEMAHALVAKANGLSVRGITLWLLGGVAELQGEPRSPRVDFAISVVGPITSVLAGVVFGAVALVVNAAGLDGLAFAVPAYLAGANVLLAVFNMIPAAPLDGGRVLRAVLWRLRGDRYAATISAANAGRIFGFALIVLGFALLVLSTSFNGLWLALIGWFLVHAATAEAQQAGINQRLAGLRVADVMTPQPVTAPGEQTVAAFINDVALHRMFSSYPLTDADQRFQGLVTLNRLRAVPLNQRQSTRLADIACPADEVPATSRDALLTELLPRMSGCADGRAVVTDSAGRLVGIVSPSDISRAVVRADIRGVAVSLPRGADLSSASGGGPGGAVAAPGSGSAPVPGVDQPEPGGSPRPDAADGMPGPTGAPGTRSSGAPGVGDSDGEGEAGPVRDAGRP